jgi:hypothetical protein
MKEFEDTKRVIRIRKTKERQLNGQQMQKNKKTKTKTKNIEMFKSYISWDAKR